MRATIIFCLTFLSVLGYSQDLESIIKGEREAYIARQTSKTKRAGQSYDMVYQHLKLTVIPDVRVIEGSVVCKLIAQENDFTLFAVDLDDRMLVDSVHYQGVSFSYQQINDEVVITVPSASIGDEIDVEIFYHGNPTENENRGFTYDWHQTGPIAWTLSEPYGAYGWWPNKQDLQDKIDSFDMSITVPSYAKSAGLGLLVSVDTLNDTMHTYNWVHRYPVVPYLVAVTVTNFYEESHYIHLADGDSVYHLDYLYPEYKPEADTLRHDIDGMMRLFDSMLGRYPFINEKYGHAQFARGGGMEHQTMSSMSNLNYTLMAHELAHQWYGNKITCGSWRDLWLNESFATYLPAIAYEFLQPREEFIDYMTVTRDRAVIQPDGSIFAYDTINLNDLFSGNIKYRKGAMVLHNMRWELGDEVFFQGLRDYTADANLCYDFAHTADFKFYMEQASGVDLTDYFDRWIFSEGHPIVETLWNRIPGSKIQINVKQTTSHPSVSFYPLNIEYRAVGIDKDTTFVVDHRNADDAFTIDVGFKVVELIWDPNVWLPASFIVVENDHQDLFEATAYPNPLGASLSIFVPDFKVNKIEIVNAMGQKLAEYELPESKNEVRDIDVSFLTNGVYFLRATNEEECESFKLIKTTN